MKILLKKFICIDWKSQSTNTCQVQECITPLYTITKLKTIQLWVSEYFNLITRSIIVIRRMKYYQRVKLECQGVTVFISQKLYSYFLSFLWIMMHWNIVCPTVFKYFPSKCWYLQTTSSFKMLLPIQITCFVSLSNALLENDNFWHRLLVYSPAL